MLLSLLLAATACSSTDAALPAPLAGWSKPDRSANVTLGRPVRLTLSRVAAFKATTRRDTKPGVFGASVPFTVEQAGSYEVALSEAAWIDVVRNGTAVESVTHRHGPDCTTIRKIVAFKLQPGTYALQISGSEKPAATVAVYRAGGQTQ